LDREVKRVRIEEIDKDTRLENRPDSTGGYKRKLVS